jgi:choline dehydrogenase
VSFAAQFDYIVIGGGSAGCVVASRLSEDATVSVALIEAGPPDRGRVFELPGLYWLAQKSSFDWDFETEPEPALDRRRAYLPRGRVLGGTSSINTMVYIRGNAYDYDRWAKDGCAGWSYEDVLPYFRRSEDNERGGDRFHGTGGPLRVSDARSVHPLIQAWVAAALEAGHPRNGDFNGAAQDGVGVYQMTQRDGLRASAATAYLRPALARPNLSVLTSTRALRITFRRRRVVGVEVEHLGATRTIGARREVVLSAGAYQSPQLLLLSGIGATEQLEGFGIPVIAESPEVGENLQDHPGCFLSILTTTPDLSDADTPENEALLRRHGHGPLTWTEGGGFLRTGADSAVPDVQFHVAPGMFIDEGLSPAIGPAISFGPYVNRPRSRGRVTLRSALAQAKPRIVHNYLTDEHDRAVLRDGLRLAMEIARQSALGPHLKDVRASVEAGLLPPSDADDDLDRYMRRAAFSFYHPAGTCRMGAVVDSELRVRGVDGLRVADTSIMPNLIGGNTNAPAMMIGEKAADLIRGRRLTP